MPSAITPGIRVSSATKVSQMTMAWVPWCAATFAAIAVLESVVVYGRMARTTAMASGPTGITTASAVQGGPGGRA